jgi:hypothetical protein
MHEVLKFFQDIDVKLTEEELKDLMKQDYSEEEVLEAREYIKSLGFDPRSFCTTGNQWLARIFSKAGQDKFDNSIRDAVVKIQATFRNQGPFNSIIKLFYSIGFSLRDIVFTLYRLGFKGVSLRTVRSHIEYNKFEFERERLKFMELIDCAKATVFQELQVEIKSAEKRTAEMYITAINKLQEALEDVDPVIEITKWNRLTKQIEHMQTKLNAMHGVDEIRSATIQTASKISLLKAAKSIEDGEGDKEKLPDGAKTIEADGDVVSPFNNKDDDKIINVPRQRLAS